MRCPRHGNELITSEVNGVEVRRCETGGGIFIDRGELDKVADPTAGDLEFATLDMDTFQHHDEHGPIDCPRDPGVQMKKVEFNIHTNIILDWCPTCGGFWIDPRELSRINEEVRHLNEADREVPDPPMVRLAEFFWNLPFPK